VWRGWRRAGSGEYGHFCPVVADAAFAVGELADEQGHGEPDPAEQGEPEDVEPGQVLVQVGWVRSYPTSGGARLLCVEGTGWNLVARTDTSAYVLTEALPHLVMAVDRGPRLPGLLSGLDAIAERRDPPPAANRVADS